MFKQISNEKTAGSYLLSEITLDYKQVEYVFGVCTANGKSSLDYTFENDNKSIFTLYDYKNSKREGLVSFHIGGHKFNQEEIDDFKCFLLQSIENAF
jgi:hypothetical protein